MGLRERNVGSPPKGDAKWPHTGLEVPSFKGKDAEQSPSGRPKRGDLLNFTRRNSE